MVLFNHVYDLCPEVSDDTATIRFFFPLLTYIISVLNVIKQTENGLVEAVAVLISKMPRLRPELESGRLGECYKAKPDFVKVCFSVPNMNHSFWFLRFLFLLKKNFISFSLHRLGRNGGHKLLSWTVVHIGFAVVTTRPGRV